MRHHFRLLLAPSLLLSLVQQTVGLRTGSRATSFLSPTYQLDSQLPGIAPFFSLLFLLAASEKLLLVEPQVRRVVHRCIGEVVSGGVCNLLL